MIQKLTAIAAVLTFAFLTACGGNGAATAPEPVDTYQQDPNAPVPAEGGGIGGRLE